MAGRKSNLSLSDDRWGGYVPWFLRHHDFSGNGDFETFLSRISQRLERLILYNEAGILNLEHFCACLESESFQRFRQGLDYRSTNPVHKQFADFFSPKIIENNFFKSHMQMGPPMSLGMAIQTAKANWLKNKNSEYRKIFVEKISVLETLLRNLPNQKPEAVSKLSKISGGISQNQALCLISKETHL